MCILGVIWYSAICYMIFEKVFLKYRCVTLFYIVILRLTISILSVIYQRIMLHMYFGMKYIFHMWNGIANFTTFINFGLLKMMRPIANFLWGWNKSVGLVLSSSSWTLHSLDVKSAYLQGAPINRDLFLLTLVVTGTLGCLRNWNPWGVARPNWIQGCSCDMRMETWLG